MGIPEDKPVVTKVAEAGGSASNVISQWWNLTVADRRPKPDQKKMITVDELPLYLEDSKKRQYQFIPDDPLPLEREFATIRKSWETEYNRIVERFSFIDKAVDKTTKTACQMQRYVEDEWSVLPKAGAITLGGMAGFVLGLKRGVFVRSLGTATGLATMAAFCYPYETVDMVRSGSAVAEKCWEDFQQSPPTDIEKSKKLDLSPPKI